MPEPTSVPHDKVMAGTVAVGVATVLWTLIGVKVPELSAPKVEVAAIPVLTMAVTLVGGYIKTAKSAAEKVAEGNRGWWMLAAGVACVAALGVIGGALLF